MDKRQYVRVSVQFRGHFSSKSRMVAGEGELRDLSPGGCRVASPVAVSVGDELEFCIFPEAEGNPFHHRRRNGSLDPPLGIWPCLHQDRSRRRAADTAAVQVVPMRTF